ncbi:MAG: class I SAM-dependent methyltransferase [Anaerolineae bacterium]|nr:class I SAM-dependent methyltransferase [Anaerolineae bacterium]
MIARLWWGLVRFGFRLLYNELAFTYDLVSKVVSLGQWRCWQRAALKHFNIPQDAQVLELAHGTGDLQLDLHAAGYQSIGYDLSPYMGQITWHKLARQGVVAQLVRGEAQHLPFADQSFAAIVCTFPTDFIFAETTLREAWRILPMNGRLVIVINGVLTGGGARVRLSEWLYSITGQRAEPQTNENQFARVLEVFARCGFEAQLLREACQRSYAQVIIATKHENLQ